MNFIQKISTLFKNTYDISHSNIADISTKYGFYKLKIYEDDDYKYLTIMSRTFSLCENPIVYIHAKGHHHHAHEEHTRYCNNQMDIALQMINTEGGVALFSTSNTQEIDTLLQQLNTRKLHQKKHVMYEDDYNMELIGYEKAYHSLGYIFKDLKLSTIMLISSDEKVIEIAKHFDINILKKASAISFEYGFQEETTTDTLRTPQ